MRRMIMFILCVVVCAQVSYADTFRRTEYLANPDCGSFSTAPYIRSVNSASFLSTGSSYSSEVFEVGSSDLSSDSESGTGRGIRKAPPGTGGVSDYDPTNPQFAPVGGAMIPLLVFVLVFCGVVAIRRRCGSVRQIVQ